MHILRLELCPEKYPSSEKYPFSIPIVKNPVSIDLKSRVTFFVGENGCGKSTFLRAVSLKCGIYMWGGMERGKYENNSYEMALHKAMNIKWKNGKVPGSFFGSQIFNNFARNLDNWATMDPGVLSFFGGKSLLAQSHGESLMAFFESRFSRKGLYLLDEPETALSPSTQIKLLKLLQESSAEGKAQFIIATHSPIIMACPIAQIYSFDKTPIKRISYKQTEHYRIYKSFMNNPSKYVTAR